MEEMPEEYFIPVLGFELLYEVSNYGTIKSLGIEKIAKNGMRVFKPEKILKPKIDKDDYLCCTLFLNGVRKYLRVQRITLASFSGEWRNETVNHDDGNKQNNFIDNLSWMTITENNRHALSTGLRKVKFGLESPRAISKIRLDTIREFLKLNLFSYHQIGLISGCSGSTVGRIKNKECYATN